MSHPTSTNLPKTGTPSSAASSRTATPSIHLESHPRVGKFMRRLPDKQRKQIARKIGALKSDPYPTDRRPMNGRADTFRVDVGEYRIVFTEHKTATAHTITIKLVDKRNDDRIYDLVNRLLG